MKLHVTTADCQTDILIQDDGSRVHAEIAGRRYELDVHESGAGDWLLISDGRVFECRVQGRPESGTVSDVFVGATRYPVTLTDPKRLRGASNSVAQDDGAARLVARMPGKVVRVLAKVGEQIDAGAGIIVVEAMKMQNEMKSPKAGTVVALNIAAGDTVNAGDVLAVVE
jgi:biotin carboxyl carrier protein